MYEIGKMLKENLPAISITAVISIFAGLILGAAEETFYQIPFLIAVIPALNDMVGDFSCIVTSRFSTIFKLGQEKEAKKVFFNAFFVAVFASIYLSILAWVFNSQIIFLKALVLVLTTSMLLVVILSGLSFVLTKSLLKKNVDPDNVIIPIATSVSDVLSVFVFSLLIRILI